MEDETPARSPATGEVVPCERKTAGRTVVAHISDLHLRLETDTTADPWPALRESLAAQEKQIDLLVVTGDLVELPAPALRGWFRRKSVREQELRELFERAREYLIGLCKALNVVPAARLLVVPGNHDVRQVRGAGWFDPLALEVFRDVFSQQLPPCRSYPELRLCFFLFDSNPREKRFPDFAAGYVRPEELSDLRRLMREEAGRDRQAWCQATKIALVHHHPMPIGPTQRGSRLLAGGEPYMLMKNSGVFMQEVVSAGVEIVLHGHRHYPAASRAAFHEWPVRCGDQRQRYQTLHVVAAGSVGKDDDTNLSYNVLAFKDSGEIALRRLRLLNANYVVELEQASLLDDEQVRAKRISSQLAQKEPSLLVRKLEYSFVIQAGSGDTEFFWKVQDGRSFSGEPLGTISRLFAAPSGYVPEDPVIEPADGIRFEWTGETKGVFVFKPEIENSPITFTARQQFRNAYYFNLQDLLDVTDDKDHCESVAAEVNDLAETLSISVVFPEGHFPRSFWAEALPLRSSVGEEAVDPWETRYIQPFLSPFPASRTVTLQLRDPIPGYQYRISWELPKNEAAEISVTDAVWLRSQEISQRLQQARFQQSVSCCLEELRRQLAGAEPLDAALFVRDAERRGLVLAAAAEGVEGFSAELTGKVVKVGRTLVGQAWRRRQPMVSINSPTGGASSDLYFDQKLDPATLRDGRMASLAVPLFYGGSDDATRGSRVAVLWLGTTSRLSRLVTLRDASEEFGELFAGITVWFMTELLAAIDLLES